MGVYEDDQITYIIVYDDYWDKFNYSQEHFEMYSELVDMWKKVFCKDPSSRPSASELLSMKWMRRMELGTKNYMQNLIYIFLFRWEKHVAKISRRSG